MGRSRLTILALAAFAAAAPASACASTRTVQVERMRAQGHGSRVYADATASRRKAVVFTGSGARTFGPSRFSATRVNVWASGFNCRGNPRVAVRIDGRRALNAPVTGSGWKDYSALPRIRRGRHRVQVYFPNPRRARSCTRRLLVDKLVFSEADKTTPARWQTVFDDEFDGSQLDQTKWNSFNWSAHSNFYDPSNALVQGGLLRLRASAPNRSAMVQTLGKFAMRYGRVEASVRIPNGQGFWPAFWLKTAQVRTVKYPEIDVFEMWMTDRTDDRNNPSTVSENYHWQTQDGRSGADHSWVLGTTDYSAGFHRFAVQWEPGSIRWFIDGVETKKVVGRNVSSVPMFLIFSLQIGHAGWLGQDLEPDANTPFPSYMDVDWVRVYQRCGSAGQELALPTFYSSAAAALDGCLP
jgi:beta-glucanase (GH16 family)